MTRLLQNPLRTQRAFQQPARQRGLTLLELLVALSIFAAMYVMGHMSLSGALDNRRHLERHADRLEARQRTMTFLTLDIEQIIARPVRDSFGDFQPAVRGRPEAMEFTRLGWANPFELRHRSRMQRVNWVLEEDRLLRRHWPTVDVDAGVEQQETLMLEGVQAFRLRYLDQTPEGDWEWNEFWPTSDEEQTMVLFQRLPRSIEVEIELEEGRTLHRFFRTVINPWAQT